MTAPLRDPKHGSQYPDDPERSTSPAGVAERARERDDFPVAPDGQRIVDGRTNEAAERSEIGRASARLEEASRIERTQTPEGRYLSWRHAQPGPIMALLAGLFTLAVRTWPIAVPQGRGAIGSAWFIVATLAGVLYLAGFFLSDRNWKRARLVLVCGAILHLIVGVLAGLAVDAQAIAPAPQAMLFDVVPAVVALIAAFLISSPPADVARRSEDE